MKLESLSLLSLFIAVWIIVYIVWNHQVDGPRHRVGLFGHNQSSDSRRGSNISMEDLVLFGKRNTFPNGVPMIVHYNYKSKMVPSQYLPLLTQCIEINPNVKFVLWSDVAAFYLVKNHFQTNFATFASYLVSKSDPLKQSDLIRYFILLKFGGIYMDLDTRCQKPMNQAMEGDSCILSREAEVQTRIYSNKEFYAMNSFMACLPNHKFFHYLTNHIVVDTNVGAILLTGPNFLTNVFIEYNKTLVAAEYWDKYKSVSVPSSDLFSPFIEQDIQNECKVVNGMWKTLGCRDLAAYKATYKERMSKAVVVHLFYHLGYSGHWHKIKELKDMEGVRGMYIVT